MGVLRLHAACQPLCPISPCMTKKELIANYRDLCTAAEPLSNMGAKARYLRPLTFATPSSRAKSGYKPPPVYHKAINCTHLRCRLQN